MKKGLTNWFFDGIIAERSEGAQQVGRGSRKSTKSVDKSSCQQDEDMLN